ncbi:hypothetical protein GSY69_09165 [Brevibacterium sp. 5221]|uniref:Uncharacterized protein n=1 Tax=Brevibacterium rongguiense TaxID=2695267 RepID=A0A6N9H8C5_9MICO|nr:hypothetical protein [Brevibacterium rongguiense]MYM20131.1 hypothetical protein [Brevibacterium rongguiense]
MSQAHPAAAPGQPGERRGRPAASLTLILGPERLRSVREALRDWSAAGLIDGFVWVPAEAPAQAPFDGLGVTQGRLVPVSVPALAGRERYGRIRVVVLAAALDSQPDAQAAFAATVERGSALRAFVREEFGAAEVEGLRVTAADRGAREAIDVSEAGGWSDVVISPSDSRSPDAGTSPVDLDDPAQLGEHLGSQVAALAGLWHGIAQGPLDGSGDSQHYRARLARSFYRSLDGTAVEDAVRASLFDVRDGYPAPMHNGTQAVPVESPEAAVQNAAHSLFAQHAGVLKGQRETVQAPRPRNIGLGEALALFFRFLFGAVRGAPGAWARGLADSANAAIASTAHSVVFGSGASEYRIVVNGVGSDGRPADWHDVTEAAESLQTRLDPAAQPVHEDLSGLWRSFVTRALTLLDARQREQDFRPIYVGARPGVILEPAWIAGDPGDPFVLGGSTAGVLGARSAQPADIIGAEAIGTEVQKVATDPQINAPDASGQLSEMGEWFQDKQRSFANRVGRVVAEQWREVRDEVRQRLDRVGQRSGADDDVAHELAEHNRIMGVRMRLLTGAAVIVALLAGLLAFIGAMAWWVFSIIAALVVLGALAGAFAIFTRGQTRLFQLVHAQRRKADEAAVEERNLQAALRDMSRLGDAYGQYLAWADILGGFIHRPFGEVRPLARAQAGRFDDMPPSAASAEFIVDDAAARSTARALRGEMFDVGWLDDQWRAYLGSAARVADLSDAALAQDPGLLLRETSVAAGSALARVGAVGARALPDDRLSAPWWEAAVGRLGAERNGELAARLLGRVQTVSGEVTEGVFLGAIGHRGGADPHRPTLLDDALLTAQGASRDAHRLVPETEFVVRAVEGFSRVIVHTQLSDALSPDDLAFTRQRTASMPAHEDGRWSAGPTGAPQDSSGAPGASPDPNPGGAQDGAGGQGGQERGGERRGPSPFGGESF